MMKSFAVIGLAVSFALCAGGAIALTNPGFETGDTTGWNTTVDGVSATMVSAWSDPYDGSVTINAGSGSYSAGFTRSGVRYNGPQASWYCQNIPVVQGQEYTVTVSGKALAYMTMPFWTDYFGYNPWAVGARIVLFNGAGPTDQGINPDDYVKIGRYSQWLAHDDPDTGETIIDSGVWRDFSREWTFTADYDFVELRLTIHDKTDLLYEDDDGHLFYGAELTAYDDLVVDGIGEIPEPGSIITMLTGLAGLAGLCIRRRR